MSDIFGKGGHVAEIGEVFSKEWNTNPSTKECGAIKYNVNEWILKLENFVDKNEKFGKAFVGLHKLLFFEVFIIESADNAKASEIFTGE